MCGLTQSLPYFHGFNGLFLFLFVTQCVLLSTFLALHLAEQGAVKLKEALFEIKQSFARKSLKNGQRKRAIVVEIDANVYKFFFTLLLQTSDFQADFGGVFFEPFQFSTFRYHVFDKHYPRYFKKQYFKNWSLVPMFFINSDQSFLVGDSVSRRLEALSSAHQPPSSADHLPSIRGVGSCSRCQH